MGKIENNLKSFTQEDVKNKELILKMLKCEDDLYLGNYGQCAFKSKYNKNGDAHLSVQRQVLNNFGYNSMDEDLTNYRAIINQYYHGSTDYDEEVMGSVVYLRENKCLYYTVPEIKVGDIYPNCRVYELNGKTETSLYNVMEGYDKVMVGAFSTS